jgi:hypothetical protein
MWAENLLAVKLYTLIKLAAIVWFSGVVILLIKSSGMFIEAVNKGAPIVWVIIAVLIGLVLGRVKAKYLFVRICNKNIKRILALESPKIWQFYRTRFFFFLFGMILFGNYAYGLARNNIDLIALAVLELSISTALFISSKCFYAYYIANRD